LENLQRELENSAFEPQLSQLRAELRQIYNERNRVERVRLFLDELERLEKKGIEGHLNLRLEELERVHKELRREPEIAAFYDRVQDQYLGQWAEGIKETQGAIAQRKRLHAEDWLGRLRVGPNRYLVVYQSPSGVGFAGIPMELAKDFFKALCAFLRLGTVLANLVSSDRENEVSAALEELAISGELLKKLSPTKLGEASAADEALKTGAARGFLLLQPSNLRVAGRYRGLAPCRVVSRDEALQLATKIVRELQGQ
jgi:hypothetical protein